MTRDPRHLHAIAALYSLAAAWPVLLERVEAGERAADDGADLGTLRSPVFGTIRSRGPARSAIADAIADGRAPRWTGPHMRLLETTAKTVGWLGERLLVGGPAARTADSLLLLRVRVPKLHPDKAADLAKWVAEADGKVRGQLGLGDDRQLITGRPCPYCSTRRMAWRTSAPALQRVIVCEAGCTCSGDGCPCGMSARPAGVAHVWTWEELKTDAERIDP